jgi:hypothetical protein
MAIIGRFHCGDIRVRAWIPSATPVRDAGPAMAHESPDPISQVVTWLRFSRLVVLYRENGRGK